MPPAKATPAMLGMTIKDSTPLGGITAGELVEIGKRIEELSKPVREYKDLEQAWRDLALREEAARLEHRKLSASEAEDRAKIERRLDELRPQAEANEPRIRALKEKASKAAKMLGDRAKRALKPGIRLGQTEGSRPIDEWKTLKEVKESEAYYTAAALVGDEATQDAIKRVYHEYETVAVDPKGQLSTHEYRMMVREQEGLGLKERGQGICFKMLDQWQMMSPKEKSQMAGAPNVIGCTEEGVRQWLARNAEFMAERAQKAFEQEQEVEKARQEMQDLRLTCFPLPDWVRERIQDYPQKPQGLNLGMKAPLPVPFTREEVIQSVRDVLGYSPPRMGNVAGQCAPVDPTSVHIAKHVARVLEHWFSAFGWVTLGRGGGAHLGDRIDKLHNDPFTVGFSPRMPAYATPLELGPSFTTTFDTEQRMAAAPAYLRLFGRPVFGPGAALAQELEAAGQLTPENIARVEEMIRSGVTWEQLERQRAGAYSTGESVGYERPVTRSLPGLLPGR